MTSNSSNSCFNISSNHLTEEYWNVGGKLKIYGKVTAALLLLYILIGLPWNLLVVITILRKRLYLNSTIMLLLNLALADFLFLSIYMPVATVTGIAGEYIVGNTDTIRCHTCLVIGFFTLVVIDSFFVITLMSIDRLLFIYKPLRYERMVNTKTILLAITVAAILSIALGLFPFATPNKYIFLSYYQSCSFPIRDNWYNMPVIIFFLLSSLHYFMVCNIWIGYIVQKNIKQIYTLRKISYSAEESDLCHDICEKSRKNAKRNSFIYFVFGCLLLSSISLFIDVPVIISSPGLILFLSQVVVHPMIETLLIHDVREPLKKMITCGLLKKMNNLTMAEEQIPSCSFCCGDVKDDKHSKCFILRLIDEAFF